MKKINQGNVQQAFISFLLQEGHVELVLPNNMVLEVGITQENEKGDLEKIPDYCWVIATQKDRSVLIDKYNLGLRYQNENKMIHEYEAVSSDGQNIKMLDVI